MIADGKFRIADAPGTGTQMSNIQPSSRVPMGPPGGLKYPRPPSGRRLGMWGLSKT